MRVTHQNAEIHEFHGVTYGESHSTGTAYNRRNDDWMSWADIYKQAEQEEEDRAYSNVDV